jgi:hypothetical protein
MTILHRRLRNILVALGAAIGVACVPGPTGPPTATVLTVTLVDSTVALGDTLAGEAIATASYGLIALTVTVFDGADTILIDQGSANNANRLDAKFKYQVTHASAGAHVRVRVAVYSFTGDSTIAVDSALVAP